MTERAKPFAPPHGEPQRLSYPDRFTFGIPVGGLHFRAGLNLTVRKGGKWHGFRGEIDVDDVAGNLIGKATVDGTVCVPFYAITDALLLFQHDPSCYTLPGLYDRMREVYPDFGPTETVTLVFFRMAQGKGIDSPVFA